MEQICHEEEAPPSDSTKRGAAKHKVPADSIHSGDTSDSIRRDSSLHWLLSQSLFILWIEVRDGRGDFLKNGIVCTCGYSASKILAFTPALSLAIIPIGIVILKSHQELIPYGAISSLILSAACHPPPVDIHAHLKLIEWGVVKFRCSGVLIRHCSLNTEDVSVPGVDQIYA